MRARRRALVVALSVLLPLAALLAAGLLAEGAWRAAGAARCALSRKAAEPAFDLYGVGESTMTGDPYTSRLAPAQAVSRLFDGRLTGRPIAVTTTARRGERLFHQALRLDHELRCRDERGPGAVLLYSGDNDVGFPVEPTTRAQRALQSVLYRSRLLTHLIFMLQRSVPALRIHNLAWWRFHLDHVLASARAAGLEPVVITVPVNLADADPGIDRREASSEEARALLEAAARLEKAGGCAAALPFYDEQAERLPRLSAYFQYEAGRCALALGRREEAARRLRSSLATRHLDNFGRATPWQNDAIRKLGRAGSAAVVDAEALFAAKAKRGVPSDDLFADAQHPNADGYALLDDALAQALGRLFGQPPERLYGSGSALLASTGRAREEELTALKTSGYWLLMAAVDHHYPRRRLEAAEKRLERAARLAPEDFSAALGAAVARGARTDDRMADPVELSFLDRYRLYDQPSDAFSDADWAAIKAHLSGWGVPPAMLERAERARSRARATLGS